jgi:hypothetical protein
LPCDRLQIPSPESVQFLRHGLREWQAEARLRDSRAARDPRTGSPPVSVLPSRHRPRRGGTKIFRVNLAIASELLPTPIFNENIAGSVVIDEVQRPNY